jgi:hypothetical protein
MVARSLRSEVRFFLAGTYISLFANSIVTSALIIRIWRAKRKMEVLLGNDSHIPQAQIPYIRLIRILTESALPPLLLGIVHLGFMTTGVGQNVVLNLLWVSFTVRPVHPELFSYAHPGFSDPDTPNDRSSGAKAERGCRTKTRDVFTKAHLSDSVLEDDRNFKHLNLSPMWREGQWSNRNVF